MHLSAQLERGNAQSLQLKLEHAPLSSRQLRPCLLDDILLRPRIIGGIRIRGAGKYRQRGPLALLGMLSVEFDRDGDGHCRVIYGRFEDTLSVFALAGDPVQWVEAASCGCDRECLGEDCVSEELCYWLILVCGCTYTKLK